MRGSLRDKTAADVSAHFDGSAECCNFTVPSHAIILQTSSTFSTSFACSTLKMAKRMSATCCVGAELVHSAAAEAAEPAEQSVPKVAPRPRGLWGVVSPQASQSSPARRSKTLTEPEEARQASREPDQAPCRGTSLVGSGISMSALSSSFQVCTPIVCSSHSALP